MLWKSWEGRAACHAVARRRWARSSALFKTGTRAACPYPTTHVQRSDFLWDLVSLPSSPPGKAANPERHAAVGSGRWSLPLHREEPRRSTPAATEPVSPHEAGPQDRLHETYSIRRRRRRTAGQSINTAKPRAAATAEGSGMAVMVKVLEPNEAVNPWVPKLNPDPVYPPA